MPAADAAEPLTLAWAFERWRARHGEDADLPAALQVAPDTVACLARSPLPVENADVERLCAVFDLDFERLVDVLWEATAGASARRGAP
jgi:hypothetical protein